MLHRNTINPGSVVSPTEETRSLARGNRFAPDEDLQVQEINLRGRFVREVVVLANACDLAVLAYEDDDGCRFPDSFLGEDSQSLGLPMYTYQGKIIIHPCIIQIYVLYVLHVCPK